MSCFLVPSRVASSLPLKDCPELSQEREYYFNLLLLTFTDQGRDIPISSLTYYENKTLHIFEILPFGIWSWAWILTQMGTLPMFFRFWFPFKKMKFLLPILLDFTNFSVPSLTRWRESSCFCRYLFLTWVFCYFVQNLSLKSVHFSQKEKIEYISGDWKYQLVWKSLKHK